MQQKNRSMNDSDELKINIEDSYNMEQLVHNFSKDNFELRNNIEIMKKTNKKKLEELQTILNLPCDIEYLLKNKDSCP